MKNKKLTTYQMAVTALMAAALCVLGPLSFEDCRCRILDSSSCRRIA